MYHPKYAGDKYMQCVNTWGIGSNNYKTCAYVTYTGLLDLGCTNNGVTSDTSSGNLGLAALFGTLSFF